MLWMLLFIAMYLGAAIGFIFLVSRIYKKMLVHVIPNKKIRMVFSIVPLLALLAILWVTIQAINAIIVMIHLMIFWLLFEGIFAIAQRIRKKTFQRYYVGAVTLIVTTVYLAGGWYAAHHVWQKEYTITTDKKVGDLRVAFFADSHVGTTFHSAGFAKHMKEIEAQKPDVLLIIGDYVDDDTSKEDMIRCSEALGKLNIKYGVYFVFGNHDKGYYSPEHRGYDGDDLIQQLEQNKVRVLQDENVLIDDRFYLVGRQDRSEEVEKTKGRSSMKDLTDGLDQSKFSIVMDHQPDDYADQAESQVDLVVSGHTHGGQLFPLRLIEEPTKVADDRVYGYEKRDNTNFIVTSGISDWAIKFKTGCRSEYVIVDIKGQ